jgi:hypothetical protein
MGNVHAIADIASRARVESFFKDLPHVGFAFEILDNLNWNALVRPFLDAWVQHSVAHISKIIGRKPRLLVGGESLFHYYCLFRFKPLERAGWQDTSITLAHGHDTHTVVLIALERLHLLNGCFMHLDIGHWHCMDAKQSVDFPSSGGGVGIYVALKI